MKKHILIVEDDLVIAEMLVMLLEMRGYSAQYVENANLALSVLLAAVVDRSTDANSTTPATTTHASFPDLILLDFVLPDMSGVELIRDLVEKLPMLPPTIIMSALPRHMLDGIEYVPETVQFLPKPFPILKLIERLELVLAN